MHLPQGRVSIVCALRQFGEQQVQSGSEQGSEWGDQTFEEMMIGWFGYVVPAQPPSAASAGTR